MTAQFDDHDLIAALRQISCVLPPDALDGVSDDDKREALNWAIRAPTGSAGEAPGWLQNYLPDDESEDDE